METKLKDVYLGVHYGATHFLADPDGSPALYYKQGETKWNDGTISHPWKFLSHCGIWMNSECSEIEINNLVEI